MCKGINMENILEIKDVRKHYGKKEVLKGVNLSVKEGEIISVLGPSGCGKSTLLNIIAGILPLDGGAVCIHGKEVSGVTGMTRPRAETSTWYSRILRSGRT